MSNRDLYYFWLECEHRRTQQLQKLISTAAALQTKLQGSTGQRIEYYSSCFMEQEKWVREATDKLIHASTMVKIFKEMT